MIEQTSESLLSKASSYFSRLKDRAEQKQAGRELLHGQVMPTTLQGAALLADNLRVFVEYSAMPGYADEFAPYRNAPELVDLRDALNAFLPSIDHETKPAIEAKVVELFPKA